VVRFALCQQPIKFDPADDALLAAIAQATGPCEFWLAAPAKLGWATSELAARLGKAFRSAGLDPEQYLRVTRWLPPAEFLGFLDEMDVFLDCPAFSGYTTAWQALHRGLPIVTLEGAFMRQRLAAGLLRQAGAPEGIAATQGQYVEIATRLAVERRASDAWSARRAELRQHAPTVDSNEEAVREFGETLIEARSARSP
jgi:protein O-GlcNAc transferase